MQLHLRIRPRATAESLPAAQRQLLQVARALAFDCRILVLDEPTTALTDAEADHLFAVLAKLKAQRVTLLYVSHRLPEVFRLCDRITVLRDGALCRHVRDAPRSPRTASSAPWSGAICRRGPNTRRLGAATPPALEVRGLDAGARLPRRLADRRAAARSSGSSAWSDPGARSCSKRSSACTVPQRGIDRVDGRPTAIAVAAAGRTRGHRARPRGTPSAGTLLQPDAAAQPHDAGADGRGRRADPARGRERAETERCCAEWRIKAAGQDVLPDSLSGGNQQKVVLAKWLATCAARADARRANQGRGRRRQIRDPRNHPPAGGRGPRLPGRVERPPRSARALPPRGRDARRARSRASSRDDAATEESVMHLATHELEDAS